MSGWAPGVLALILVAALALQAVMPAHRLLVVTCGAALSALASAVLGVATTGSLLASVPWDVLVILVALGLFSELVAATRVFGVLAAFSTRASQADPRKLLLLYGVGMYVVSGLVNNLTALLLVMPIVLSLLKLLGVGQRYVTWTLGTMLVACNLGGAATPIGDFPAILLLGRGAMTFEAYLRAAAPPTLVALAILLAFTLLVVRPQRAVTRDPVGTRITIAVMAALYRRVRVDARLLVPLLLILTGMLASWMLVPRSSGVGPELIAWVGAGAGLLLRPRQGERLARTRVDMEATLFLFSLFVMVGAVSQSGVFVRAARAIGDLPIPPAAQLVVFLLIAGVTTGLFSAGPAMAALLEVAESLARTLPPTAVYVGLALAVCAGSSLFLTAATSGPMAQMLTERADLRAPDGTPIRFGFFEFARVGGLSFALIMTVAIGYGLRTVAAAG